MKIALLLPGYLDSPDYLHMKVFEKGLQKLGYVVERIDPCDLWKTDDVKNYTITNYIKQVTEIAQAYADKQLTEIVLVGHSLGAFVAIIVGNTCKVVSKIVSLCPPPDRIGQALKWQSKEYRHSERELPENPNNFRMFDIPASFNEDGFIYSAVEAVKEIEKPLMIFIAMEDKSVPPSETERIVEQAKHPYVVRQPKMGHDFRKSQVECDLVMSEIEKFLEAA